MRMRIALDIVIDAEMLLFPPSLGLCHSGVQQSAQKRLVDTYEYLTGRGGRERRRRMQSANDQDNMPPSTVPRQYAPYRIYPFSAGHQSFRMTLSIC